VKADDEVVLANYGEAIPRQIREPFPDETESPTVDNSLHHPPAVAGAAERR
jgi:hypothetical protein